MEILPMLTTWLIGSPKKLEEENAKREEAGEEPYKEEDGTPVRF